MPGVEPHVVGDDQARRRGVPPPREVVPRVAEEPDHGPRQREVVEHVAADGRVLGRPERPGRPGLGGRRDRAYGAPRMPPVPNSSSR